MSHVVRTASGADIQLSDAEWAEFERRFVEGGPGFNPDPAESKPPGTLADALARFQAELPEVIKAEEGKVEKDGRLLYKYSYADLAAITRAALPLLGRLGFSWITKPTLIDGQFALSYKLLHVSGESEEGIYPLPARATPQETGSAITYARRYALCSVTGIAPDDDDDAAEAQGAAKRGQLSTPKISQFEERTGLALLAVPTDEQRTAAGPAMMRAAFQQALDFRACLHEKGAWELRPSNAADDTTWGDLFAARINGEIQAIGSRDGWVAVRAMLDDAELGRAYAKALKDRGTEVKLQEEQLINKLTTEIVKITDFDGFDSIWAVVEQYRTAGNLSDDQAHDLAAVISDRRAKIQREAKS